MERILIDAGMSAAGWSYWAAPFTCDMLHAFRQLIPSRGSGSTDAQTRGSMVHVGLAHLHARWGARQPGGVLVGTADGPIRVESPDELYEPEEAVATWVSKYGAGEDEMPRTIEALRRYAARNPEPPRGLIFAIEYPMRGVLGMKAGRFGLWAVSEVDIPTKDPNVVICLGIRDGARVTPCIPPGWPKQTVEITRRADLIMVDSSGEVDVVDHKSAARAMKARAIDEYGMEGGWAAMRILTRQTFDGVRYEASGGGARLGLTMTYRGKLTLNMIETLEPWSLVKAPLPGCPWADGQFADDLWRTAARLGQHLAEKLDPWRYPKVRSHTVCFAHYDRGDGRRVCPYLERCQRGPGA